MSTLIERLRATRDSGRRTLGGGSISHDGKCEMWGGEPIMVQANPDGGAAADRILALEGALRLLITDCGYHLRKYRPSQLAEAEAILRGSDVVGATAETPATD